MDPHQEQKWMCEGEDEHLGLTSGTSGPCHDSPHRHLNRSGGKKEKGKDHSKEANEAGGK